MLPVAYNASAQHIVTALAPARNAVAIAAGTAVSVTASTAPSAAGLAQLHVFSREAQGKKTGTTTASGNMLPARQNRAALGQQALSGTIIDFPTAALAPGLYLLSVSTPNAAPAVPRVVVQ